MSLTRAERKLGRLFRDVQQAQLDDLNAARPPDEHLPDVRHVRHLCPAANGKSISFDNTEVYILSPASDSVPAGRFGFVYHQGECPGCRRTSRSRKGRVVDGYTRLPSTRHVKVA